jgi:antitoxin component of RelBE/YafQ-DinJ toxin-antitoxin module
MREMHPVQHLGRSLFPLFLLVVALAGFAGETPTTTPVVEPPKPSDEDIAVGPLTEELIKQIQKEDPASIWEPVSRLVRLGKTHGAAVTARLETELASPDEKVRLAAARVLCQLGLTERAAGVLAKILESGTTPELRRLAANAVGLTTTLYGDETISKTLAAMLKLEKDELTRISIARSLWRITSGTEGRDELLRTLTNATDKNAKDEAALVLAESGLLHMTEVRLRLLNLYTEPTAQGERAFNLLRRYEEDGSRTRESKLAVGEQLLREILRDIKSAYPDETKYDLDALFESAAKGMVSGLDQFSQYMDRDEVKATQEMLQQDYSGIGAYVGLRNGQFIVTSPIYGSPADRAGLRAMDIVQEVDGLKPRTCCRKAG